jgi:DNA integrity scanning protein DisA with diadenylate cyclase activity
MSTLEREILNYVAKLDAHKQQQILDYVRELAAAPVKAQLTLTEWLEQADAFREELVAKYGVDHFGNVQDALDDVREERLNDLMGRR